MVNSKRLTTILIATNNPGKAAEMAAVLSENADCSILAAIQWRTPADLDRTIAEPVEDRDTFADNSRLKATYYSNATGLVTLADDSGLEVDALGGAPGVLSARYAGVQGGVSRGKQDAANNEKLIAALRDVPESQRTARFHCVLTLADGDQELAQATGTIEGRIIDEPRGQNGFGYDPHFLVPALAKTTAELDPTHKNRISHRGQALRAMRQELRKLMGS